MNVQRLLVVAKRFRGKINLRRPQKPIYERALLEAVTNPIYPRTRIIDECREKQLARLLEKNECKSHPYQRILSRELFERLNTAKTILFCHVNSYKMDEIFTTLVELHKQDLHFKRYGKHVLHEAIHGTKFEAIECLFSAPTCIIYSEEHRVVEALKIIKKARPLILLAGIVDDRFLSKNELVEYSNLPSLDILRAKFAAELNSAGSSILNKLQAQQSNLCYLLEAHARILGESNEENSSNQSVENSNENTFESSTGEK